MAALSRERRTLLHHPLDDRAATATFDAKGFLRACRCPGLVRIAPVQARKGRLPEAASPGGEDLGPLVSLSRTRSSEIFSRLPGGRRVGLFARFGGRGCGCCGERGAPCQAVRRRFDGYARDGRRTGNTSAERRTN